jgi:hypothetical protein
MAGQNPVLAIRKSGISINAAGYLMVSYGPVDSTGATILVYLFTEF